MVDQGYSDAIKQRMLPGFEIKKMLEQYRKTYGCLSGTAKRELKGEKWSCLHIWQLLQRPEY